MGNEIEIENSVNNRAWNKNNKNENDKRVGA